MGLSWAVLGVSEAALGLSWAVLELSGPLLGLTWAVLGRGGRVTTRCSADASPWNPLMGSAQPQRPSLVPRSSRHLGRHGNGKSASETCPRMLTPLCVIATLAFKAHYVIVRTGSLGVQSFFASPFALESSGVERFLTSPSVLGSLAVKSWLLDVKLHSFKRLRKLDDLGLFVPSWGSLGLS